MPTPEQWQEYAAQRNKYQYGKPTIEPEMLVGRQLNNAVAAHINRPDTRAPNIYPANYGFGATPPQPSQNGYQPLPATPGQEWASLESKWGIKRPEAGSLPSIDSVIRPAPTPLEVGENIVTPILTSLGNGYGVAGANTSGRAGYSNRTYYGPSGNVIGSGVSSATGRGGFVGATTDAEAERNLQARLEQDSAAKTMAANMNRATEAMRELRAAQIADLDGYKPEMPTAPGLDQQKFIYQQKIDADKFLLDREKLRHQQAVDKQNLELNTSDTRGKQSARQLERQKYMDEARKTFVNEFAFSDPKAPKDQIAGAVFDISQATGVPTDVVSQFYEQVVKDLKIDYSKGGPKDPMALNKLVATRIAQAYQGQ